MRQTARLREELAAFHALAQRPEGQGGRMRRLQYVPLLADDLRAMGACAEQVALFEATFGATGATPDDVPKAVAAGLDVQWLVCVIAPATAWRAYDEAWATAWRAYEEATDSAWRAYQEAIAPAWRRRPGPPRRGRIRRPYDEAWATAWRAYQEATAALAADCLAVCWPVWEGDR